MLKYLLRVERALKTEGFFYFDYVVDEQGRLVHMFWADATCRKNYAHFGDLVSFDSTYNINEYGLI